MDFDRLCRRRSGTAGAYDASQDTFQHYINDPFEHVFNVFGTTSFKDGAHGASRRAKSGMHIYAPPHLSSNTHFYTHMHHHFYAPLDSDKNVPNDDYTSIPTDARNHNSRGDPSHNRQKIVKADRESLDMERTKLEAERDALSLAQKALELERTLFDAKREAFEIGRDTLEAMCVDISQHIAAEGEGDCLWMNCVILFLVLIVIFLAFILTILAQR
ncbi:uncharacterized protein BDZ99DRAFT_531200 [Mytilinidion resinicola]|uniref:Uncharacterized protein n=1 Tax=Mytilinidion resinicola TaxID=574789 RepID=A0A6A6ZCH5_9PEZI|nr:uncharacterized protein BDZ99DRAFT_531200 [Mytilinidion resinicola]KAF2818014.1 hypothetical protein BDZ99DRAFT_531200 [Mytilinidion resinicola]